MLIKIKRGWEMRESEATPEALYLNRRSLVKAMGLGAIIAGAGGLGMGTAFAAAAEAEPDPSAGLYPVKRNDRYTLDRPITDEKLSTDYNNFYEFSDDKELVELAQALPIRPWSIAIDGMVEKPMTIAIDDLLKQMPLEERLYRHRCVEAWSMAVPWSGFPLKSLVDLARPLGSAKYVQMVTFQNPKVAPGQRQFWYPWPYVEGLTMFEATNELRLHGHGHVRASRAAPGRRAAAARSRRGNTASSRSSRSSRSPSPTSAPRPSGRRCSRRNTASGPTSTRPCRIRAGARRPSACSASTAAARR